MATGERPIEFLGSSLADLRAFPEDARLDAGCQLGKVQNYEDTADWKPMKDVGLGAREIRIKDASGAFRVLYVAKFEDVVYVLHCFQKRTQKTAKRDLALARDRYRDVIEERGHGE